MKSLLIKLGVIAALLFFAFCAYLLLSGNEASGQMPPATPAVVTTPAPAAAAQALAAITGSMDIVFNTRLPTNQVEGVPKVGVKDTYTIDWRINGSRKITGIISRQPRIRQMKIRTLQQAQYDFSLRMIAVNTVDAREMAIGSWVGVMPTDPTSGAFMLDSGQEAGRPLRISIDSVPEIRGDFGGRFYGKAEDKSKLSFDSIKRTFNGRTVEKRFQADPMRFENMVLAEGPDRVRYPRTSVTGELTFDREEGNYYAKNLRMRYTTEGREIEDVLSGSIKWIEDPARASNGKGRYEFNIRFNEEKNTKPAPVDAAFAGTPSEDIFFAIDTSMPTLRGTVTYQDTMQGSTVTASKVVYDLKGQGMTQTQMMNFAKLWVVAVGPTNDE